MKEKSVLPDIDVREWVEEFTKAYMNQIFVYQALFGNILDKHGKVDIHMALRNYDDKAEFRKNFENYLEAANAELNKKETK